MATLILAVTTLLLYGFGTALHVLVFRDRIQPNNRLSLGIGLLALLSHGALAGQIIWSRQGLDLGFLPASVLIAALIVACLLILAWRRPVQGLFLVVYPLAGLVVLAALVFHAPPHYYDRLSAALLTHIALSVTAYSLFSLAAFQAALLWMQDAQLKRHHNGRLVRHLPPLQVMDSILFDLLWTGLFLLTLAIISGALFMEDMFAQKLAHKTVFSLLAWALFAALLAGRQIRGWRGATASRWTLTGCLLLMLGYYGSKVAVELILGAT